ncbi:FlaA1/EpsC-like NDP-sugar epimerase [Psychroflexus sp. MBR-150]
MILVLKLKKLIFSKVKKLSRYHLPRSFILFIDVSLCLIALFFAFILIDSTVGHTYLEKYYIFRFVLIFFIQFFSILIFKSYLGIVRYTTLKDAFKQIQSILFTVVSIFALNFICDRIGQNRIFPNSGAIIYGFIAFSFLFLYRITVKQIFQAIHKNSTNKYVYILGVNLTDVAIAESINSDSQTEYKLAGFISDSKKLKKKRILDLPILNINEIEASNNRNTIVINSEKLKRLSQNNSEILSTLLNKNFSIYKLPEIENWDEASILSNIKKVKLEDLLQRNPIKLNKTKLHKIYNNKTILVTGAAGSIGSDIVKQLTGFNPKKIILLDQAETPLHFIGLCMDKDYPNIAYEKIIADVTNLKRLEYIFETFLPDIVFHGAAYKHVPMMECNPIEALDVNFRGTKNLVNLSHKFKVDRFVFVSTDKAVNPTNIMGASKRCAEIYVQSISRKASNQTTFIMTRFGNVLGSNGSVIPHFKRQIEHNGPVTVTHPEITRYFMTIDEACQLVLEAGGMGKGGEIFVFDMGKPVKILDLAHNMIRLSGFIPNIDIPIEFTGLRPGEKLYEELLADKENTQPTHHQKIMIAKATYDFDNSKIKLLDDLDEFIKNNNQNKSLKALKMLVPEFQSKTLLEQLKESAEEIS